MAQASYDGQQMKSINYISCFVFHGLIVCVPVTGTTHEDDSTISSLDIAQDVLAAEGERANYNDLFLLSSFHEDSISIIVLLTSNLIALVGTPPSVVLAAAMTMTLNTRRCRE